MDGTTRFFGIRFARNCTFAVLLLALLLGGCDRNAADDIPETASPPANASENTDCGGDGKLPQGEETLTAILDRDGSDGYAGDYVLVYHPDVWGSRSKSMGTLDGLVETTTNRVPTREGTYLKTSDVYSEADPYLTEEIRQADPCYDLADGNLWQVGFQRIFNLGAPLPGEMLFEVSAVGERCRVWSPVNPAYGPLEGIDPAYPEQLAREMDAAIPVLEQAFGSIPDIRGDGKMNILCCDFNNQIILGYTSPWDIYEELNVSGQVMKGNRLPIVHINTAPLIQGTFSELSQLYTAVVHEMQHVIFLAQYGENGSYAVPSLGESLFGEFLATAAQEIVYPGSAIYRSLPWWYSGKAVWEDLAADDADAYLRDSRSNYQSGFSIFTWDGYRDDYAVALLLAHFAENRGVDFFELANLGDADISESGGIWESLWEELGYEDYPAFVEDFLLSVLLHEEDGPYRLKPFAGYDPALCGGEEDPFSHLVPIITDKGLYIRPGGYAVLRPVGGVYVPPATASNGLRYVGITLKTVGNKS